MRAALRLSVIGCLAWAALAAVAVPAAAEDAEKTAAHEVGLRAPAGFEVSLFAGDDLAHDIYSMTLDSRGRVVVAGAKYIKTLHDDDGDGRADRATEFADFPASGAHGMVFSGHDLYCTGDDAVLRLRDADGDGRADGPPETLARLTHREHGANGVLLGPDGWLYVICGNDAGVSPQNVNTSGSPVREPLSGAVVRISPDGRQTEVVAHGFRNPYDADFNAWGQLFLVDADGERDHHMPWYAPNRLFDVAQGWHHGWVLQGWQRSWNRPQSYFDNVARLIEVGRGSPTGHVIYRHRQFPADYRGDVLHCCWTLGRVYRHRLTPEGATYAGKLEVFLETTGEVGFAPVDLAVGPEGDLFVAIGGRRTRGSVFRVRYPAATYEPPPADPLLQVLDAPQPLAAWSRARWQPTARSLGRPALVAALTQPGRTAEQQVRAVETLVELFGGLSAAEAAAAVKQGRPELSARVAWALSRAPQEAADAELLAALTRQDDPRVQRAAWEAIAALPDHPPELQAARWDALASATDRRIRAAALLADRRRQAPIAGDSLPDLWRRQLRGELASEHFPAAARGLLAAQSPAEQLSAIRLMHHCLGDINTDPMKADVYAGYSLRAERETIARLSAPLHRPLADLFPTPDAEVNRELARLLAMLRVEDASLIDRLTRTWSGETTPEEDIHFLIVLSQLPGERSTEATRRTAAAVAGLHPKMRKLGFHASRNWPTRVGEAFAQACERDPALPAAVVAEAQFRWPVQALFAAEFPAETKAAAARKLLRAAVDTDDDDLRWSPDLVNLAAALPAAEARPALREAWQDFGLRDVILKSLAANPQPEDRARFIEMLAAVQPTSVVLAAETLATLGGPATDDELLAAFAALRQACATPEYVSVRRALGKLLFAWTGLKLARDEKQSPSVVAAWQPWFDWCRDQRASLFVRLSGPTGVDPAAWQKRLAELDWTAGDADRGKLVFSKKACVRCHSGSGPLGPDLAGAAGRFSREDLFAAIVDPNKDVAPLYQTTQVITSAGRIVHGLIVYESPDGTLVQTAPDSTVRIAGPEIVGMRKSRQSLMPTGLLNDATDADLADLYAYLKTLRAAR